MAAEQVAEPVNSARLRSAQLLPVGSGVGRRLTPEV